MSKWKSERLLNCSNPFFLPIHRVVRPPTHQVTRLSFLICVGIVGLSQWTHAAFDDQFVGARAYAMGGAFAATANESDGLLVNPASISNISVPRQLSATMARLHVGLTDETSVSQNLISYANPVPLRSSLGLLWKRLNVSELYSENYLVMGLSKSFAFGTNEKRRLSIGTALKLLNWDTAPTIGPSGGIVEDLPGSSRFCLDAGVVFRPSENIPIALSVQNINTPNIASKLSKITEELPVQVTLGIGILGRRSTWGMDLVFNRSQTDVKIGIEQQFYDGKVLLRGGFRLENLAWGANLTLGGGYHLSRSVRMDYGSAFPIGGIINTNGSHRVTIVYNL